MAHNWTQGRLMDCRPLGRALSWTRTRYGGCTTLRWSYSIVTSSETLDLDVALDQIGTVSYTSAEPKPREKYSTWLSLINFSAFTVSLQPLLLLPPLVYSEDDRYVAACGRPGCTSPSDSTTSLTWWIASALQHPIPLAPLEYHRKTALSSSAIPPFSAPVV
jgi:hypothetical protein